MYNYESNENETKVNSRKKPLETAEEDKKKLFEAMSALSEVNEPAKVFNCDRLNIRAKPDFSAPIIATITEGSRVTITGTPNEKFYAIKTVSGIVGYCAQHFIKRL